MSIDLAPVAAAIALRRLPAFRNTSLRLVTDLAERSGPGARTIGTTPVALNADILVVLAGEVELTRVPPPDEHGAVPLSKGVLTAGNAYIFDRPDTRWKLQLVSRSSDGALVKFLQKDKIATSLEASAALRKTVDRNALGLGPPAKAATLLRPDFEGIWICEQEGLGAPLEALTHLLAASAARDFEDPVALGVFEPAAAGEQLKLGIWDGTGFGTLTTSLYKAATVDAVVAALNAVKPASFYRLFLVRPADSHHLPKDFDSLRFDRVVYVTNTAPKTVPAALDALLVPGAGATGSGEPYFSSFISSVLLPWPEPEKPGPPWPWLPWFVPQAAWFAPKAKSKALPHKAILPPREAKKGPRPADRLERDTCRVRLPLERIRTAWPAWTKGSSFRAAFLAAHPVDADAHAETLSRWARAVTNKLVGVALSGGGASSYRIVPLIEKFRAEGVPIDVLSGVSGGALLGAYYCKDGAPGLAAYEELGPLLQLCVFLAILDSSCIEWLYDRQLHATGVDELERRFVPVATALRRGDTPEAHAITGGTLGEAVRASGAAPVLFSPTQKGRVRYSDGAAGAMVPVRILSFFGADIVFAFNSIPGPAAGNPLGGASWLADVIYRWTPAGRFVDMIMNYAFLLQRTGEEAAADADEFAEPTPQEWPLVESAQFWMASWIVASATADHKWEAQIQKCVEKWLEFGKK